MAATNVSAKTAATRDEQTDDYPQKITTFLWYDNNAEEAVNFYTSIFKNSKVLSSARYTGVGPGPKGTIMMIDFELDGVRYSALNGGPHFKFTEAISLLVHCQTQEEVDYFWEKLSEGGEKSECGWVKDKFGLSWQITPNILLDLQKGGGEKQERVMAAMLKMKKIDIKKLEEAAAGK